MLETHGKKYKLVSIFSLTATLTNFIEGYSNAYPNTAGDSFEVFIKESYGKRGVSMTEWTFTLFWSSFLNIWFIGYLFGTLANPIVCDIFGRKKSLLGANILAFAGASLCTVAICLKIPELLFVGRLLCSVASGISFGALILFLSESAPTNLRGLASSLSECVYLLISVVGMLLGMDIVLGRKLEFLLGFAMLPTLLSILILIPLPESPKYLLMNKKDREGATKSLKYYQGEHVNAELLLNEMLKESVNSQMSMKMRQAFVEVFRRPSLRRAAFVGILALQLTVPIWPLSFLSSELLENHFSPQLAQMSSFVFIAINFTASLIGMFFVEKFGRRKLLISLGIANTLTLILYVLFDRLTYFVSHDFRWGQVASLILYGFTYGFCLGPIAFFITSELVPQRFRSIVQSLVFAINTIENFVISFATLPMYRIIGVYAFLPLFVVPSTLSLIYLYFKMPETRGREIHEIVAAMGHRRQRLPSSTNELFTESTKSNCTPDTLSSTDESEDEEQQRQPLNFNTNLCLASSQLKMDTDKILIEKF